MKHFSKKVESTLDMQSQKKQSDFSIFIGGKENPIINENLKPLKRRVARVSQKLNRKQTHIQKAYKIS